MPLDTAYFMLLQMLICFTSISMHVHGVVHARMHVLL
jgi:hypothetical protein